MSMLHQYLRYRPRYSSSSQQLYHFRQYFLFALKQMQAADFWYCSHAASLAHNLHRGLYK
ncbi:hypothetical protein C4A29_02272 [Escherichia coli]|nr:hypothetical protein C4A29_02272 [Escherichia coli]RDQ59880.1 hypothetical protein C4A27_02275 [Escherichia coli]CAD5650802.1 Uncharacterised protein [Escherichia coli]